MLGPQYASNLKLIVPLPQVFAFISVLAGVEWALVTKGTVVEAVLLEAPFKLNFKLQLDSPIHDSPTLSGKYA